MIIFCPVGRCSADLPPFFANFPPLANGCQLQPFKNQWVTELLAKGEVGNAENLPIGWSPCGCWVSAKIQVGENSPSYYVGEGNLRSLSYASRSFPRHLPVSPHPHKSILALDLNEVTGWALSCPVSGITSGSEVFGRQLDDGKLSFARFGTWLQHLNTTVHGLEAVYFGQIGRFLTLDMARAYGGLLGQLTGFCEARRMSCQEVPIKAIHQQLNLNRKATAHPEDFIAALQKRGFSPEDHHEATALATLIWALNQGA